MELTNFLKKHIRPEDVAWTGEVTYIIFLYTFPFPPIFHFHFSCWDQILISMGRFLDVVWYDLFKQAKHALEDILNLSMNRIRLVNIR